jgi:hypothetical protein
MVKVLILVLALVLLLLTPQAVAAQSATPTGNGEISGSVVNGTSSGGNIDKIDIKLAAYENNVETVVQSTQSNSDGKFMFTGIPTDSKYSYQVKAIYQQVEYFSSPLVFETGQTVQSVEVEVFETTTESVPVSIMMSHAILNYSDGLIVVKEYYYFVSGSDRTYLGKVVDPASGRRETLKLSLPDGVTDFQGFYGLSDSLVKTGSDLSFSAPLYPGTNEIVYVYSIPCDSSSYTITWNIKYDTQRFDLLISNEKIQARGADLKEEPPLNIGGQSYQDYSSDSMAAGDKISVKLSGLLATSQKSLVAFAWLAIIPVAAVVAYVVWQRRKKSSLAIVENKNDSVRQKILAEIAELDDQFEVGLMKEEDYAKLRSEKKQQLINESKVKNP